MPADNDAPSDDDLVLPSDDSSDSESDSHPTLGKFASPSSSDTSESEAEPNLGGYEVPEFDFSLNMFSFGMPSLQQQQGIENNIPIIDLKLSETQPYQYQLQATLKEEKKQLLKQLEQGKGKRKIDDVSPVLYNPVELYRSYPEGHDDRQR